MKSPGLATRQLLNSSGMATVRPRKQAVTYYKWLTPDLASHRDPRFKWRPGRVNKVQPDGRSSQEAEAHGLFLMKRSVDALRFGHWPGRLFRAEPVGPIKSEDEFKVQSSGVRLLEELDAAAVFGPWGHHLLAFLSHVKDVPWLEARKPSGTAVHTALEHQARLAPWGWVSLPVVVTSFDNWNAAAECFSNAERPAVKCGAWTAWAGKALDWHLWTTPWAASQASRLASAGVQAHAGVLAWTSAKQDWRSKAPPPDIRDREWRQETIAWRLSTRILAGSAAEDAARRAEYIIRADQTPSGPLRVPYTRLGRGLLAHGHHRGAIRGRRSFFRTQTGRTTGLEEPKTGGFVERRWRETVKG